MKMYITFLKDYEKDGLLLYRKGETNDVKNDMLARYLIRRGYGVSVIGGF